MTMSRPGGPAMTKAVDVALVLILTYHLSAKHLHIPGPADLASSTPVATTDAALRGPRRPHPRPACARSLLSGRG
jgi:hypothetical protein